MRVFFHFSSNPKWKWLAKPRNSILITYLHQKSFYIRTFHFTPRAICNKLTISFDFYFYSFVLSSRTGSFSELHFSIFIFKLSPITRQWNFLFFTIKCCGWWNTRMAFRTKASFFTICSFAISCAAVVEFQLLFFCLPLVCSIFHSNLLLSIEMPDKSVAILLMYELKNYRFLAIRHLPLDIIRG